jgi:hypothetical protein
MRILGYALLLGGFVWHSKIRYGLVLPPACMMLAGGLVLGSQARKRLVRRIYTNPPSPEIKSKLDELRGDLGAARQPVKSHGFRRSLLRLIRLTVSRSTYFRARESDEHSDVRGPEASVGKPSLITKK